MQSKSSIDSASNIGAHNLPTEEAHILDILIKLFQRWRIISGVTLGACILATIIVLLIPNKYTAETVILPPAQNSSMGASLLGQLGNTGALASIAGGNLGLKNPGDLYVSLLHSRTVEDAMVQRFSLMGRYHEKALSEARKALEAHSQVAAGTKDSLITIYITDRDPSFASKMANGYIEEYQKLSERLAITEAAQRRTFFQQQLLAANQQLTQAEEAMKHTQQDTGILQADSQMRALIETAASLRAQVVAKQVQVQSMRTYAADENPELVQAKQQLAALESQLASISGSDKQDSSGLIIPKSKVPEAGMEYLRKMRDVKYYETLSDLLARQFELAKVDEARQGVGVQVVDYAIPPDRPSAPKRILLVLVAGGLVFLFTCFYCISSDGLRRMKNNPTEADRLAALRASFK